MSHICQTKDCGNEAKFECPTCKELGIKGSYFCSQSCFKSFWEEHKLLHTLVQLNTEDSATESQDEVGDNKTYNLWPNFKFSGKMRPYPQTPIRTLPCWVSRPDYANNCNGISECEEMIRDCTYIDVLNSGDIDSMRAAGRVTRECFEEVARHIDIGITTDELDRRLHEAAIEHDCYPSTLLYHNFPKSCCTSVNEVICLGTPDLRPLQNGDICTLDVALCRYGFHARVSETIFVGNVSQKHKNLVKVAHECMMKAIEVVRPGTNYQDLGNIIEGHANKNGYSVIKSYYSHGIHRPLHATPKISHFANNSTVGVMKPGHCFTIEPIIAEGDCSTFTWPDGWNVATEDGLYSAQFGQTVLVTENGYEILTNRPENDGKPWFLDPDL